MLRKFLPRNDNFFDFFEKHAATIVAAAKNLLAFALENQDKVQAFHNIKFNEQEGDKITHHCIEALHKTFITPIDRTDIHRLISTMDDVLDEIEDVAKFMILYKLEALQKEGSQLVKILVESVNELESAIKELRKLKNTKEMQNRFIKINQLENEADTIFLQAIGRLFEEEKEPIKILKWKEIYDHLEHATDRCEDVINILEGIILEHE
jgi:uncharacterized protein